MSFGCEGADFLLVVIFPSGIIGSDVNRRGPGHAPEPGCATQQENGRLRGEAGRRLGCLGTDGARQAGTEPAEDRREQRSES